MQLLQGKEPALDPAAIEITAKSAPEAKRKLALGASEHPAADLPAQLSAYHPRLVSLQEPAAHPATPADAPAKPLAHPVSARGNTQTGARANDKGTAPDTPDAPQPRALYFDPATPGRCDRSAQPRGRKMLSLGLDGDGLIHYGGRS